MTDAPDLQFKTVKIPPISTLKELDPTWVRFLSALKESVDALQEINMVVSTDSDGLPSHGSACPTLRGQWLRLTQQGAAPSMHTVNHGLRRKPVGIFTVSGPTSNRALIAGLPASNVAPASSSVVVIELNGSDTQEHLVLLY